MPGFQPVTQLLGNYPVLARVNGVVLQHRDALHRVSPRLTYRYVLLYSPVLLLGGAGLLLRKTAYRAAFLLGFFFLACAFLLHIPRLIVGLSNGRVWTAAFETLAIAASIFILSALLSRQRDAQPDSVSPYAARGGLICYGIALPVFGVLHFIYPGYVASVIPSWIPGHLFWTYAVGILFCAAGLSILTGIQSQLAALLTGSMFGLWVLILHAPRVVARPHNPYEWTSLFVALTMCGGAFLIAANLSGMGEHITS